MAKAKCWYCNRVGCGEDCAPARRDRAEIAARVEANKRLAAVYVAREEAKKAERARVEAAWRATPEGEQWLEMHSVAEANRLAAFSRDSAAAHEACKTIWDAFLRLKPARSRHIVYAYVDESDSDQRYRHAVYRERWDVNIARTAFVENGGMHWGVMKIESDGWPVVCYNPPFHGTYYGGTEVFDRALATEQARLVAQAHRDDFDGWLARIAKSTAHVYGGETEARNAILQREHVAQFKEMML